jgi:hypothetical protein
MEFMRCVQVWSFASGRAIASALRPMTNSDQHGGIDGLFRDDINNQTVNGWSAHSLRNSPGDQFSVELGMKLRIVAKNMATSDRKPSKMFVEVLRSGQTPEDLYSTDGSPRRVSRSEYERFFPNNDYQRIRD